MAFSLFLIYLAATFIRPFELFPDLVQFSPMALLGGTALLIALVARALGGTRLTPAPQLPLILVLVLWAAFTVFMVERSLTGAVDTIVGLSTNLFIFYLLVLSVDTLRRLRITLHLLTALAVIISLESTAAIHFGYRAEELIIYEGNADEPSSNVLEASEDRGSIPRVRHRGVLQDPNDLSQALVALIPFVLLGRRPGEAAQNLVRVWLPVALMVYVVYLTRSRGGVLALLAMVFLLARNKLPVVYSAVLTVAGAAGLLALGVFAGRAVGMDASAESRTDAWRAGWAMLKSSPIWGVGLGYFIESHGRAAHNSFVQCFAEIGLVGYFFWLGTLVVTFWSLRQMEAIDAGSPSEAELRRIAHAGVVSLSSFLVAAFFLSRTYQPLLFVLLGLATAVIDLARRYRLSLRALSPAAWVRRVVAWELGSILLLYAIMRLVP